MNYKEVATIKLPRAETCRHASSSASRLYPVTVTERDSEKVRIHYVGYSSSYDEWREMEELETLEPEADDEETDIVTPYQPYSLYNTLRLKIKQSLTCGRKSSPTVRISMAFDIIQFTGGLKAVGRPFKMVHGVQHYTIVQYQDLNPFLGSSWHFRGLNANGDYGYAELKTIDFCLRKSRNLVEYYPSQIDDQPPSQCCTSTGYVLLFCFVCNYGTAETFGKDKKIFC